MNYPNKFEGRQKDKVADQRLIIGRKPLIEALKEGAAIEKIFILQSATGEEVSQIRMQARDKNVAVSFVPVEKLDRLTKLNHQGVVAVAGLIEYRDLQDTIDMVIYNEQVPIIVVLDGITDTRNLGAIARSAYCYGAHALVVPISNNAAITEESIKTSAGALEKLPICRVASIQQAIDTIKANDIKTIVTALHKNATPIHEIDFKEPVAIILGSEDKGVSNFVIKTADHLVKIPMSDQFDSLNVSVASGIIFYEAFQQRMNN